MRSIVLKSWFSYDYCGSSECHCTVVSRSLSMQWDRVLCASRKCFHPTKIIYCNLDHSFFAALWHIGIYSGLPSKWDIYYENCDTRKRVAPLVSSMQPNRVLCVQDSAQKVTLAAQIWVKFLSHNIPTQKVAQTDIIWVKFFKPSPAFLDLQTFCAGNWSTNSQVSLLTIMKRKYTSLFEHLNFQIYLIEK